MDIRDAVWGTLYDLAVQDESVIVLTADMGFQDFARFRELKGQFYNVGISEQNMVSMAAGLAMSGRNVFIYSIIPFLIYRAFEQVKLDICSQQMPVTLIGGCAGLSNSTDGITHHGIHDIAIMRNLDITIFNPSDENIAQQAVRYGYNSTKPVYIRLDKGELPLLWNGQSFNYGYRILKSGKTFIITTGIMVQNALEVDCGVIDIYRLKPLEQYSLLRTLWGAEQIITLEEHLNTGLGSIISEFLHDYKLNIPLKRLGVDSRKLIGSRDYLHKQFGIDVESLKRVIEQT